MPELSGDDRLLQRKRGDGQPGDQQLLIEPFDREAVLNRLRLCLLDNPEWGYAKMGATSRKGDLTCNRWFGWWCC